MVKNFLKGLECGWMSQSVRDVSFVINATADILKSDKIILGKLRLAGNCTGTPRKM